MDFRIFIEPQQGTTYDAVLALARKAERLGFDGFFTSDHLLAMGGVDGRPGPLEAWTTLAGLARETERLRIGTLVTPVTFRHPGVLAVTIAQVDHMSGGRVEPGFGTGWYDEEHAATGVPFPPISERFERLEEALEIVTGIWATPEGETFDHQGEHYQVSGSPGLPKPAQSPAPPIVVGGWGRQKTPALAARFAAEWNAPFGQPAQWAAVRDDVRAAAGDRSMLYTAAQVVCVGDTEDDFVRRAAAIGREPDELRANGVCGVPDEAAARIEAYRAVGADRLYLQVLDIDDLDHLDVIARVALRG